MRTARVAYTGALHEAQPHEEAGALFVAVGLDTALLVKAARELAAAFGRDGQ